MDKTYIYLIGLALVLILFVILIIIHDMKCFRVVTYRISCPKATRGFHFVFLSDLHNASFGKNNKKLIDKIKKIRPDAVLVGGDLYTSHPGAGRVEATHLVCELARNFPVYMANGNHETKTKLHPKDFDNQYEEYVDELTKAGATFLVNDHLDIPDSNIRITGYELDHRYFVHFIKHKLETKQIENVVGKCDETKANIMMAHHPIYLDNYAEWGADLVLSGHIHGGIARIPFPYSKKRARRGGELTGFGVRMRGIIAPMIWLFPIFDGGLFEKGKTRMILSRGLSTHTLPIRFNNPGELVEVYIEPN